ncbi:hypothetical protein MASR1M31_08570 [Porphyromonadaceae bacterium]
MFGVYEWRIKTMYGNPSHELKFYIAEMCIWGVDSVDTPDAYEMLTIVKSDSASGTEAGKK